MRRSGTELLGAIIRKVIGKPIEVFAQEALFAPLGITDVQWGRYPDQIPAAASGLQLRPRDLAKLGQLVLQRGLWDGKKIVSAEWLDEATAPQIGLVVPRPLLGDLDPSRKVDAREPLRGMLEDVHNPIDDFLFGDMPLYLVETRPRGLKQLSSVPPVYGRGYGHGDSDRGDQEQQAAPLGPIQMVRGLLL